MKYPRTPHLPGSPGLSKDDRRIVDVRTLLGDVVVTEKMDGSNLCMTRDDVFSRSHSGAPRHPSFDLAKALHAGRRFSIPESISVFGEWCFAVHSIEYNVLPDYFLVFAVLERDETWLSWDAVEDFAERLDFPTAPIMFEGRLASVGDVDRLVDLLSSDTGDSSFGPVREGFVVRRRGEFAVDVFPDRVAKWVRADHVQTDDHWMNQEIRKQGTC